MADTRNPDDKMSGSKQEPGQNPPSGSTWSGSGGARDGSPKPDSHDAGAGTPAPGHDSSQVGGSQGSSMGATEDEPQKGSQQTQNPSHPQAGAGSGEHSGQDTQSQPDGDKGSAPSGHGSKGGS